jgi:FkbM family methyltransferase
VNPWCKRVLHAVLPHTVVQALRLWHAPRVARRFTDRDWPYAATVRNIVQAGDTVIDVGANMGYITARLADYVGPGGSVIALEPVPDTFALLQRTVQRLGLSCVEPVNAAASNAPGRVVMEIPQDQGGENLYESRIISSPASATPRQISVPALRLDDLCNAREGRISFIKIDVEGHELEVITGARTLLTKHHPALLIEVTGDPDLSGSSANTLLKELGKFGYSAYEYAQGRLQPRQRGTHQVDYWFQC